MEKNVKISMLCSIYGKLLTKKQLAILEDYYDNETVNGRFVLLDDGRRDNIVYDNATGKEYSLSYDVKEVVRLLNTIK